MESVTLKVTSAFLVGGNLARPGELVEVTVSEAKDLLARGKVELATAADEPAPADSVGVELVEVEEPAPARRKRKGG